MSKFDILVPHGRRLRLVQADGIVAEWMHTLTLPGQVYDVQTWGVTGHVPINSIQIEFDPY